MEFAIDHWLCGGQPVGQFSTSIGNACRHMVYMPSRDEIFGTQSAGGLVKVKPGTEQVESTTLPTTDLWNICYGDGTASELLYIVDRTNNTYYKVNPATLEVLDAKVMAGGAYMVVAGGGFLYIPNNASNVYKVRESDLTIVGTYTHDQTGSCESVGLSPDNQTLYVAGNNRLWKISTSTLTRLVPEQVLAGTGNDPGVPIHVDANEQYCYFAGAATTFKCNCSDCTTALSLSLEFESGISQVTTARLHLLDTDYMLATARCTGFYLEGGVFNLSDLSRSGGSYYAQATSGVGDMIYDPIYRRMWVSFDTSDWCYFNITPVHATTSGEVVSEPRPTAEAIAYYNVRWDAEAVYAGGTIRPRVAVLSSGVNIEDMVVDEANGYFYTSNNGVFSKRNISDHAEVDSYNSGNIAYEIGCLDNTGDNLFISGDSMQPRRIRTSDMTLQATAASSWTASEDMIYDPNGTYVYLATRGQYVHQIRASDMAVIASSSCYGSGLVFDDSGYLYTPDFTTDLHRIDTSDMSHTSVGVGLSIGWESPLVKAGNFIYGVVKGTATIYRVQISPFTGGLSSLPLVNAASTLALPIVASPDEAYLYAFDTGTGAIKFACWRVKVPEFYIDRVESVQSFSLTPMADWTKFDFIRAGATILGHNGGLYIWELEVEG